MTGPEPRVGSACTSINDKIYYFGGRGGVSMTCLESNEALDVYHVGDTPSWSMIKPANREVFPEDRSYHSMTSNNVDTVYIHAGCPAKGRLNDLWSFDTIKSQWKQLKSAPGGGRGGTSIAFSKDKLYRVNGFDGKTEQGGTVDVYDVARDEWTSVPYQPDGKEGPEPRSVGSLVPVQTKDGRVLLVTMFGEGSPSDLGHAGAGRMFSDAWAFDVDLNKWVRIDVAKGDAPASGGWFDADVWRAHDGQSDWVVVHGGVHDDNRRIEDIWTLEVW